jgi:Zn-dependent peptidase ImmA (M78 family)
MWNLTPLVPIVSQVIIYIPKGIVDFIEQRGWNTIIGNFDRFRKLCTIDNIVVLETEMSWDGLYMVRDRRQVILLNTRLEDPQKTFVAMHELAHAWLHTADLSFCSDSTTNQRKECQANILSSVSLLPRLLIDTHSNQELQILFNYPPDLLAFRREVNRISGI